MPPLCTYQGPRRARVASRRLPSLWVGYSLMHNNRKYCVVYTSGITAVSRHSVTRAAVRGPAWGGRPPVLLSLMEEACREARTRCCHCCGVVLQRREPPNIGIGCTRKLQCSTVVRLVQGSHLGHAKHRACVAEQHRISGCAVVGGWTGGPGRTCCVG